MIAEKLSPVPPAIYVLKILFNIHFIPDVHHILSEILRLTNKGY